MTDKSIVIHASEEAIYDLVADPMRMAEWSPECVRCQWIDGATQPAVGARFRGTSRNGSSVMSAEGKPPANSTLARAATTRSTIGRNTGTSRVLPLRASGPGTRSARRPSNPRNRASILSMATGNPLCSRHRLSSFRHCSAPPAVRRADGNSPRHTGREIFAPFDFHQTNANK